MFRSRALSVAIATGAIGGTALYVHNQRTFEEARVVSQLHEKPPTLWQPPKRLEMINRLKGLSVDGKRKVDEDFDLLIIGAGASGAGCAVDAAARGLKVACVEKCDFSAGTSSKSTKLVHGGVRYLEKAIKQLDIEQFKLVTEALRERFTFLHVAPYLATQLPIMLPIYKSRIAYLRWYMVPYYWVGSKMYDILSGMRGLESSYFLSKTKAIDVFPMLKKDDLVGAMVYYDGQMNDSRVNIALALTAANLGAAIANYVEVTDLVKENGKIKGAVLRDTLSGDSWTVKAKGVINATGPFTDSIRKMDNPSCQEIVAPSAGVHIVLPSYFGPRSMGLVDPSTSDGRVIFFLPWGGATIAGTTDTPTEVTYSPKATQLDVDFIVNEVSGYFSNDINLHRNDILAVWSGIRPLVKDPAAKNTEALVRNHMINVSDGGLLTIAGGKWTTYRAMAEETVDRAISEFKLNPIRKCPTEHLLLVGSHGYSDSMYLKLIQQYGLDTDVAQHLACSYGDRSFAVATIAEATGKRWPFFGKRLAPQHPFIEAEVRYAVRNEYAVHATVSLSECRYTIGFFQDVLGRRMRIAFIDCQSAFDMLPRVVEIMAQELGWDKQRQQQEITDATMFLNTMGLDLITPHQALFNKEDLLKYRREFAALDSNNDGTISEHDLKVLMDRIGIKMDHDSLVKMIAEIDINKDGVIEMKEFLEIMSSVNELKTKETFSKFMEQFESYLASHPERSGGGV